MNTPIKYKFSHIVIPLLLGAIAAVSINYRLTNYLVGFTAAILFFALPSWILSLCQKYYLKGVLLIMCLQIIVFSVVVGLGIGIFYLKLNNSVVDIENHRSEIVQALKLENPELPGYYFSKKLKNGSLDIFPCWSNDTIIYYSNSDYFIVIPITRPLFLSFSSFKVLTWENDKGWRMDRISWMLTEN